jgi:hypothetical protein
MDLKYHYWFHHNNYVLNCDLCLNHDTKPNQVTDFYNKMFITD